MGISYKPASAVLAVGSAITGTDNEILYISAGLLAQTTAMQYTGTGVVLGATAPAAAVSILGVKTLSSQKVLTVGGKLAQSTTLVQYNGSGGWYQADAKVLEAGLFFNIGDALNFKIIFTTRANVTNNIELELILNSSSLANPAFAISAAHGTITLEGVITRDGVNTVTTNIKAVYTNASGAVVGAFQYSQSSVNIGDMTTAKTLTTNMASFGGAPLAQDIAFRNANYYFTEVST